MLEVLGDGLKAEVVGAIGLLSRPSSRRLLACWRGETIMAGEAIPDMEGLRVSRRRQRVRCARCEQNRPGAAWITAAS